MTHLRFRWKKLSEYVADNQQYANTPKFVGTDGFPYVLQVGTSHADAEESWIKWEDVKGEPK